MIISKLNILIIRISEQTHVKQRIRKEKQDTEKTKEKDTDPKHDSDKR